MFSHCLPFKSEKAKVVNGRTVGQATDESW